GTKIAVTLTLSKENDAAFLHLVTAHVHRMLALKNHLVAVATTGVGETCLALVGSSPVQVQRAALLACAKFVGRLTPIRGADIGPLWLASVREVGWTPYDEAALWDVLTKSSQELIDPTVPPPGSRPIAQILESARTRLQRLSPQQAFEELHDASIPMPVLLVDIRPHAQREAYGTIRGALVIERNVLEWRFDPRCLDGRLEIANRYDLRVIVICQEGYTSSLAAASLQDVGLLNATDVEGGFKAWKEAGLPVEVRSRW
ncbi:Rhodanese-like domain-containing protein, partial [Amylostereum chailletii]